MYSIQVKSIKNPNGRFSHLKIKKIYILTAIKKMCIHVRLYLLYAGAILSLPLKNRHLSLLATALEMHQTRLYISTFQSLILTSVYQSTYTFSLPTKILSSLIQNYLLRRRH